MCRTNLQASTGFPAHILERLAMQIPEDGIGLPVLLLRVDVGIFTNM